MAADIIVFTLCIFFVLYLIFKKAKSLKKKKGCGKSKCDGCKGCWFNEK